MNKGLLVVVAIVIGLALFVAGGGAGVLYQTQKDADTMQEAEKMSAVIKSLSSGLVPSIVAYGEVSIIDGNNVTLSYNGKSMLVKINKDAKVYSFVSSTTPATQKQVKISDIKKGDRLNITIRILPDSSFEGQMVIIIGSSAPVK